ncbi:MAG TPA: sulfatase-like hydrolase/transferase, partial [Chthoniobacterales bacterium]
MNDWIGKWEIADVQRLRSLYDGLYSAERAAHAPARNDGIVGLDSRERTAVQRRLMEVFAGFTEHVDTQIGRLVDEVDRLGYGDNTIIFYIWGDNGSSAEGQNG